MVRESQHIYSGKLVKLVVDTIQIADRSYIREVIRHPGGVVVLAELEKGQIPFVRQLRYPIQKMLLELPAGKIDPGEDPPISAAREMEEETGFCPESLQHVFSFYPTPGFCDELLHLYYTDRVRKTSSKPEDDEDIVVEFHTLPEAIELGLRGEIIDAKTLLALFWLSWRKRVGASAQGAKQQAREAAQEKESRTGKRKK